MPVIRHQNTSIMEPGHQAAGGAASVPGVNNGAGITTAPASHGEIELLPDG
jgi:hypothetical protein